MFIIMGLIGLIDKILDIIFMPVSWLMHGIDNVAAALWSGFSGLAYVVIAVAMLIAAIILLPKEILDLSLPNVVFMIIVIIMCLSILT